MHSFGGKMVSKLNGAYTSHGKVNKAQPNKPLVANRPAMEEAGEPGKKAGTALVDLVGQGLACWSSGKVCTAQRGWPLKCDLIMNKR